ncbi:membrane-associated protein, putative [Bodo saltans]|uniref:Membrane-associated protein, putative n=1 Tax=Bodo saltans TaxID=75058 RepID=A0A0S4IJ95_BODSA|nr:membrane-associated protein, putative [Bodo saltans]|eukprot:CUE77580.1 membrane-associated protein, putative [Bodo saltans]
MLNTITSVVRVALVLSLIMSVSADVVMYCSISNEAYVTPGTAVEIRYQFPMCIVINNAVELQVLSSTFSGAGTMLFFNGSALLEAIAARPSPPSSAGIFISSGNFTNGASLVIAFESTVSPNASNPPIVIQVRNSVFSDSSLFVRGTLPNGIVMNVVGCTFNMKNASTTPRTMFLGDSFAALIVFSNASLWNTSTIMVTQCRLAGIAPLATTVVPSLMLIVGQQFRMDNASSLSLSNVSMELNCANTNSSRQSAAIAMLLTDGVKISDKSSLNWTALSVATINASFVYVWAPATATNATLQLSNGSSWMIATSNITSTMVPTGSSLVMVSLPIVVEGSSTAALSLSNHWSLVVISHSSGGGCMSIASLATSGDSAFVVNNSVFTIDASTTTAFLFDIPSVQADSVSTLTIEASQWWFTGGLSLPALLVVATMGLRDSSAFFLKNCWGNASTVTIHQWNATSSQMWIDGTSEVSLFVGDFTLVDSSVNLRSTGGGLWNLTTITMIDASTVTMSGTLDQLVVDYANISGASKWFLNEIETHSIVLGEWWLSGTAVFVDISDITLTQSDGMTSPVALTCGTIHVGYDCLLQIINVFVGDVPAASVLLLGHSSALSFDELHVSGRMTMNNLNLTRSYAPALEVNMVVCSGSLQWESLHVVAYNTSSAVVIHNTIGTDSSSILFFDLDIINIINGLLSPSGGTLAVLLLDQGSLRNSSTVVLRDTSLVLVNGTSPQQQGTSSGIVATKPWTLEDQSSFTVMRMNISTPDQALGTPQVVRPPFTNHTCLYFASLMLRNNSRMLVDHVNCSSAEGIWGTGGDVEVDVPLASLTASCNAWNHILSTAWFPAIAAINNSRCPPPIFTASASSQSVSPPTISRSSTRSRSSTLSAQSSVSISRRSKTPSSTLSLSIQTPTVFGTRIHTPTPTASVTASATSSLSRSQRASYSATSSPLASTSISRTQRASFSSSHTDASRPSTSPGALSATLLPLLARSSPTIATPSSTATFHGSPSASETLPMSSTHIISASHLTALTVTKALPITSTLTRPCQPTLSLTPNSTTTTTLQSGVRVVLGVGDEGDSFAPAWCAALRDAATQASAAALFVSANATVSIVVAGVGALSGADGLCSGVVLVLTSSSALPHRSSFLVTLRVDRRAFGCLVEAPALTVAMDVVYVATPVVSPAAVEAAAGVTAGAALPVASVAGPGVVAAMQRAMLLTRLAACDYSLSDDLDAASNPTQIAFGEASGAALRGSVVGNCVLLVAIGLLGVLGAGVRRGTAAAQGRTMTLWRAAASLALPGWMVAPSALLLQPLVSSGVALVVHSGTMAGGGDVALGVVGLVVGGGIACSVTWAVTVGFRAEAVPFELNSDDEDEVVLLAEVSAALARHRVLRRVSEFLQPRFEWRDVELGSQFTKRYHTIFDAYKPGRQWFVAVEFWGSVLAGVLGGVMPSDGGTCFVLLVTLCVANFVLVAAMLALRPYNSHPDFALSVAACGVGAFSGVASLVEDDEAAATLALIGVWLALVLLLLQMLLTPRAARGFRRVQRVLRFLLCLEQLRNIRHRRHSRRERSSKSRSLLHDGWEQWMDDASAEATHISRLALELPSGRSGNLAILVMLAARANVLLNEGTKIT